MGGPFGDRGIIDSTHEEELAEFEVVSNHERLSHHIVCLAEWLKADIEAQSPNSHESEEVAAAVDRLLGSANQVTPENAGLVGDIVCSLQQLFEIHQQQQGRNIAAGRPPGTGGFRTARQVMFSKLLEASEPVNKKRFITEFLHECELQGVAIPGNRREANLWFESFKRDWFALEWILLKHPEQRPEDVLRIWDQKKLR